MKWYVFCIGLLTSITVMHSAYGNDEKRALSIECNQPFQITVEGKSSGDNACHSAVNKSWVKFGLSIAHYAHQCNRLKGHIYWGNFEEADGCSQVERGKTMSRIVISQNICQCN